MTSVVLDRPATRPALGVAMTIIAAALWALNGTVAKLLLEGGFDAPRLTALRSAGAFIGLLGLALARKLALAKRLALARKLALAKRLAGGTARAHWRGRLREATSLIIFGLCGLYLVPLLYFVAISRMPVGISLLIEFTAPVFVALWARFGEHQQIRRRLWLGLALCVAGLACVTQLWAGHLTLDGLGLAAATSAAVLLAVYYVMGTKSVTRRDPLSLTCYAFGVSALAGAITRPWWSFPAHLLAQRSHGVPMWLLALYMIILGTIAPYLLQTTAMRHLPATSVGIIGMTELFLASIFAWVLIGEVLTGFQLVGGALLLGGVVLAETARATSRTARATSRQHARDESDSARDPMTRTAR